MVTAPFKVKALFEYTSSHEDDLPFEVGQIITVNDDEDPDWYGGEYVDGSGETREGIFPRNFVEKYEPVAPPRPVRSRKKEAEPLASPPSTAASFVSIPAAPESEPEDVPEERPIASPPPPPRAAEPLSPRASVAPVPKAPEREPVASPVAPAPQAVAPALAPAPIAQPAAKAPSSRRSPPPVSEKPSSFKDRIAAFNKAAPPVAPFKPGNLSAGGSSFVKKPFIAPPPSRNAYVPPPRDPPITKAYRREEDPEIRDREAEALENAEKAGLVPSTNQEGQDEDQPKPTSLKERIALLQKQQAEAAQRHSGAAAKKPKRPPPKKRTESDAPQEASPVVEAEALPTPERRDTEDALERSSTDEPQPRQLPLRKKTSKSPPEDGNEADMSGAGDTTEGQDDLTEKEDIDEKPQPICRAPTGPEVEPVTPGGDDEEEEEEGEGEEEDDDDMDPELKRKEELRARMAKMSGGMGMMGMHMFGAPMPSPGASAVAKKKKPPPPPTERRSSEQPNEEASPRMAAPPVPTMMALPGMPGLGQKKLREEETAEPEEHESPAEEDSVPAIPTSPPTVAPEGGPPPVPSGRPAPPPVPAESRPPPPPPPLNAGVVSPSLGSESDDEMSESAMKSPLETPRGEAPAGRAPPPIPLASPTSSTSPRSPGAKRSSYIAEEISPTSPAMPPQPNKRNSRPPPVPGSAPATPAQARPPPPPPPGVPSSRPPTSDNRPTSPMKPGVLDNGEEGEVSEYEGDYDTDIASSVPHKEALKSHARDSSIDDSTPIRSPVSDIPTPSFPPPMPSAAPPRAIPPPIPSQPMSSNVRPSTEMPRAAPPPPPPPKEQSFDDDEYDPYNYAALRPGVSKRMSHTVPRQQVASPEPMSSYQPPPTPDRRGPPPAPSANRAPRQSLDVQKSSGRRSMDFSRPSMESGFVANDVDLASYTNWWLQPNGVPPAFQGRRDVFFESEEATSTAQGGRTTVTKEVYILFQDYSQTVITARFDPQNPADTQLEQRHEPPPRNLRQDQLEQAYERFGMQIATAITSKKDTVVGDGTPQGLVYELLKPFKDALLPVGSRAYGALVYANMANAATQTNDEIRPGDIISIRNAKFSGKHGPMHAKYSMEVGKPDHVAIVAEWDGTKKKVRAWEQGRESKKVKQESFKLDDLRSGEVKIWRIMPRSWVGWDSQN